MKITGFLGKKHDITKEDVINSLIDEAIAYVGTATAIIKMPNEMLSDQEKKDGGASITLKYLEMTTDVLNKLERILNN